MAGGKLIMVKKANPRQLVWKGKKQPKLSRYKRKYKAPIHSAKVGTVLNILPSRRFTKMPFRSSVGLACTGIQASNTQYWRMNSIYDPDYSNIGKNLDVDGWTLVNSIYVQYRVYGCKVKLTFMNATTATNCAVCISCTNNSAAITTTYPTTTLATDFVARAGGKICYLNGRDSDDGTRSFSRYFNMWDVTGQTKQAYIADGGNSNVIGADPTNLCALAVSLSGVPDVNVGTAAINYVVELTYYVELFDLKDTVTNV